MRSDTMLPAKRPQESSLNSTVERLLRDLLRQQQAPSASIKTSAGPSHSPPAAAAPVAAASSQQHADTEMSAEDSLAQHQPAAESKAPPAAPAAACARSPSPSAPSAPGQWTPLLDMIVQQLVSGGAPSREAALEALHVESLVCLPNLYTFPNDLLRHKNVRTKLGNWTARDHKHGVSYLGLSRPADVMHSNPLEPGAPDISCAEYLLNLCDLHLQHPQLPCVDILDNRLQREWQTGPRCYKSFPLETCLIDLSDMQKLAGDPDWPRHELADAKGVTHTGRMPDWVAAAFQQPAEHAAAAVAGADPAAPAAAAAAGADAAAPAAAAAAGVDAAALAAAAAAGVEAGGFVDSPVLGLLATEEAQLQPAAPGAVLPEPEQALPVELQIQQARPELQLLEQGGGLDEKEVKLSPQLKQQLTQAMQLQLQKMLAEQQLQQQKVQQDSPALLEAAAAVVAAAPVSTGQGSAAAVTAADATAAAAAAAAASMPLPAQSLPQEHLLDLLPEEASDSAGSSEVISSSSEAAGAHSSMSALYSINAGFRAWVGQLYPTDAEERINKATLDAVQTAVHSRAK